jgi:hypothetical protein
LLLNLDLSRISLPAMTLSFSARPLPLVAALVASLLTSQARAEGPTEAQARVTVQSDEPDLVIGVVKSHVLAYGNGVVASGVGWDDRCTAPCSFDTQAGRRELVFRSPDMMVFKELRLRPGQNDIFVDPGSWGMRAGGMTLITLGVLAAITGGSILLTRSLVPDNEDGSRSSFKSSTGWALPLTLGGLAATGGGIALFYAGRVKIEENTPGSIKGGPTASMLRLSGSF